MKQEVQIDLVSKADNTGFVQSTNAHDALTASKQKLGRENDNLFNSERRVRTNLVDLVKGLGGAQDATQSTALAISHLSEVFKVGFAGGVIAGVGAALIEQFGKAAASIKKMRDEIEKSSEEMDSFYEKLSGHKKTEIEQDAAMLKKEQTAAASGEKQVQNPGFFETALLGAHRIASALGIGNVMPGAGASEDFSAASKAQAEQEAKLQRNMNQFAVNQSNDFFAHVGSLDNFNFSDKSPTAKSGTEDLDNAVLAEKSSDEQKKQAAALAESAARDAEAAAKEAAKEKARAEREAERDDRHENLSDDRMKEGRVRATIIAGSQRQMGGGGGVYSAITRDPVVEEARKHTTLLTDIANTLKSAASPRQSTSAVLA